MLSDYMNKLVQKSQELEGGGYHHHDGILDDNLDTSARSCTTIILIDDNAISCQQPITRKRSNSQVITVSPGRSATSVYQDGSMLARPSDNSLTSDENDWVGQERSTATIFVIEKAASDNEGPTNAVQNDEQLLTELAWTFPSPPFVPTTIYKWRASTGT